MKIVIALILGCIASAVTASDNTVRLCVPKDRFEDCQQMIKDSASIGHNFKCVEGTDRLDCIDKIVGPFTIYQMSPQADLMYAEPEDLLLAYQRNNATFRAFNQVRTKEEPDAEFRYESVAVVPADTPVKSLKDLKGLKSCHTGVGRNAGYKIPFTILTKMGVMKADDDNTLSARESELKAFSEFFSKSCIVGQWSPHPDVNEVMKEKYSNLCSMCEKPAQCDYPDNHAHYDGVLRCLADGGGDVGFTKVIAVKKFFGLPHEKVEKQESKYDHTKFRYLCTDGTTKPLDGPACVWAARPWPSFIANKKFTSDDTFVKLKQDLLSLSEYGENKHAEWRKTVLGMEDYNILKEIDPVAPLQYLKKARYYDVLTRQQNFGPLKTVRICEVIRGFLSAGKCEALSSSAFSRGLRPRIECVHEDSAEKCLEAVRSNRADTYFADPHDAYFGLEKYNLKPLMMEKYGNESEQFIVGVIPKSSTAQSIKDFKGKRLCWWSSKKSEFDIMIKNFISYGIIENRCPYEAQLNGFALGSFGTPTCLTDPQVFVQGKQLFDDIMFRPFVESLGRDFEKYHPEKDFELLCPDGSKSSRMPLNSANVCNFGAIPPRLMLVKESINQLQKDELIAMFTKIGEIYDKNPDYFRLFGDIHGMPDIMVSNTATGFEVVKDQPTRWLEFKKSMDDSKHCET